MNRSRAHSNSGRARASSGVKKTSLRLTGIDTHMTLPEVTDDFDLGFAQRMAQTEDAKLGCVVYFPFIVVFSVILLVGRPQVAGFQITKGLNQAFLQEFDSTSDVHFAKTYEDISNELEFWQWVQGPLLRTLWGEDPQSPNATRMIARSNMPIGAMKLRQILVGRTKCPASHYNFIQCPTSGEDACFEIIVQNPDQSRDHSREKHRTERRKQFPKMCFGDLPSLGGSEGAYKHPYGPMSNSDEEMPEFDVCKNSVKTNGFENYTSAWCYRGCSEFHGSSEISGHVHSKIHCGGFGLYIPFSLSRPTVDDLVLNHLPSEGLYKTLGRQRLPNLPSELKQGSWIFEGTRAVVVQFFTYNYNHGIFSHLQFYVEMTSGGSYKPGLRYVHFKLFSWRGFNMPPAVYGILSALFFLWTLLYIIIFIRGRVLVGIQYYQSTVTKWDDTVLEYAILVVKSIRCSIFQSGYWPIFDTINYTIFCLAWYYRIRWMSKRVDPSEILQFENFPAALEKVSIYVEYRTLFDGINAFFVYLRLLRFWELDKRMNVLTSTLVKAVGPMTGVLIIFGLIISGFTLMAWVAYGHNVESLSDLSGAFATLLRMLVGNYDYDALSNERFSFTPFFFVLFTVTCIFVLLNMVVAVLSGAFEGVQQERKSTRKLRQLSLNLDEARDVKKMIGDNILVREVRWILTYVFLKCKMLVNFRDPKKLESLKKKHRLAKVTTARGYWSEKLSEIHRRIALKKKKAAALATERGGVLQEEDDSAGVKRIDWRQRLKNEFGDSRYEFIIQHFIDRVSKKTNKSFTELFIKVLEFQKHWELENKDYDNEDEEDIGLKKKFDQEVEALISDNQESIVNKHAFLREQCTKLQSDLDEFVSSLDHLHNAFTDLVANQPTLAQQAQQKLRVLNLVPVQGKIVRGKPAIQLDEDTRHKESTLSPTSANTLASLLSQSKIEKKFESEITDWDVTDDEMTVYENGGFVNSTHREDSSWTV